MYGVGLLVSLFVCLGATPVHAADHGDVFKRELRSGYSSLRHEISRAEEKRRDRENTTGNFSDRICGRVILEGAFLHNGIMVEVDGLPIHALSDINGYYCLSKTYEGTRNVVAWKRGWSMNQISHVQGSGGQWLPTIILYGPPDKVLAGLYVEQYGHLMWVSASRSNQAVRMENFEQYRNWWIGGIVREDVTSELGFYFQADTVAIAQFTAEDGDQNLGLQTTIPELAENLAPHVGQYRYVTPRFLRYRDLRREDRRSFQVPPKSKVLER